MKYNYIHPLLPPHLFISPISGDKYIIPTWIKVDPQTTLDDINWIKPTIKVDNTQYEVIGSTGEKYITKFDSGRRKWTCTCPGSWRAKDGKCKHIKAKINETNTNK